MKHFLVFIIALVIAFLSLQNSYMFSKTRAGESYGYFKTVTSQYLPPILANNLRETGVRYSVYQIPNFVKDFLVNNKDFNTVYNSKPKFSVLIFSPEKKVKENISNYRLKYDKDAYNELIKYCGAFCLIDPSKDTIFVFNKITNTEKESLEILFQQYSFLLK